MSIQRKQLRIGYALPPKKVDSFIQPSLLNHATQNNVDLIPIDPSKPLVEQGPFDCIVHKLYDPDWKSLLQTFSSQNPNVPIIDPPASIEKLHNRISMLEVVGKLKIPERSEVLQVPKQVVVLNSEDLRDTELAFPLIAKPLMANGSEISHKMYLIFDDEGLERLDSLTPIVLQKFVNHGGVIFKVYVAGDYVQCVKRKSLPDIAEEKLGRALKGWLPFSQISNFSVEQSSEGFESVELPDSGFVEEVARAMREELGLNLFNFDMIKDARDENRFLIIDINYFPGYAKMPNYEFVLTGFFLNLVGKNESREAIVEDVEQ